MVKVFLDTLHLEVMVFRFQFLLTLGYHGGNATRASDGGDADTIHIVIGREDSSESNAHPSRITVKVDKHERRCRSTVPHTHYTQEYTHDLGKKGKIYLSARGGDGGEGGNGGNGQGGGHGEHGRDATEYSIGTDGQHGCDGGNAGQGSSGGNGGKGGEITLLIKEEDTDLLVAMPAPIVAGGKGGAAGNHGLPGRGGQGGVGGSSYSWFFALRFI